MDRHVGLKHYTMILHTGQSTGGQSRGSPCGSKTLHNDLTYMTGV